VCLSRANEEAVSFRSFRFFGTQSSKTSEIPERTLNGDRDVRMS